MVDIGKRVALAVSKNYVSIINLPRSVKILITKSAVFYLDHDLNPDPDPCPYLDPDRSGCREEVLERG